jgi:hypothetical protein
LAEKVVDMMPNLVKMEQLEVQVDKEPMTNRGAIEVVLGATEQLEIFILGEEGEEDSMGVEGEAVAHHIGKMVVFLV